MCLPAVKTCSAPLQVGLGGMGLWQPHLCLLTGFANSLANSGLDEQVIRKLQQSGGMNQENDDQCQRRENWHLPLFSPKGATDTVPLGLGKT